MKRTNHLSIVFFSAVLALGLAGCEFADLVGGISKRTEACRPGDPDCMLNGGSKGPCDGKAAFANAVWPYFKSEVCASCHASNSAPFSASDLDLAYNAAKLRLLDPANYKQSVIVRYANESHADCTNCGGYDAAHGGTIEKRVKAWAMEENPANCTNLGGSSDANPNPTTTSTPAPTPTATPAAICTSTNLTLFINNVKPKITAAGACLSCHAGGAGGFAIKSTPDSEMCVSAFNRVTDRINSGSANTSRLIKFPVPGTGHPSATSQTLNATDTTSWLIWINDVVTLCKNAGGC